MRSEELGVQRKVLGRWERRSLSLIGVAGLLLAVGLTGCGKTLDVSTIQDAIKEDVVKKGGTTLKAVDCPKNIVPEAGKSFECVGELEGNNAFAINVTQEDAAGKVKWDIPNAKGILNLEKLQALFLESVKPAKGEPPEINCGGIYRTVKPGDSFECIVTVKPAKAATKSDQVAKADAADDSQPTASTAEKAEAGSDSTADQPKSSQGSDQSDNAPKSKTTDKTGQKGGPKAKPGQLVAIRINVDVDGNITWQQILEDPALKVAAVQPPAAAATAADKSASPAATPASTTAAQPAALAPAATDSKKEGPSAADIQNLED